MLSSAALGPAQCLDQNRLPMQLTHDTFMCLQLSTICVDAPSAPVCIAYILSGYAGAFLDMHNIVCLVRQRCAVSKQRLAGVPSSSPWCSATCSSWSHLQLKSAPQHRGPQLQEACRPWLSWTAHTRTSTKPVPGSQGTSWLAAPHGLPTSCKPCPP